MTKRGFMVATMLLWIVSAGTGVILSLNWTTIKPIKDDVVNTILAGLVVGTIVSGSILAFRILLGPAFLGQTNREKYGDYEEDPPDPRDMWMEQVINLMNIGERRRVKGGAGNMLTVNVPTNWRDYNEFSVNYAMKWLRDYGDIVNCHAVVTEPENCQLANKY